MIYLKSLAKTLKWLIVIIDLRSIKETHLDRSGK
jgi:hypothetical protein